ncbi:MAG: phosphonate transport system substrate-binding protein [Phenylobacterium sp.]|jgi:phosphonate transport system substrate-binding protein
MPPPSTNRHLNRKNRAAMALLWLMLWCILSLGLSATSHGTQHDTIVFGVTPWDTKAALTHRYQPLIIWAEQQLKLKTKLIITADYAQLAAQLQAGNIHVGFMPAVSYVKAREIIPGLTLLASNTMVDSTTGKYRDHYKGVIITLKKSAITTLEGLKNKRFGFTDPESSSGYQYPIQLFNDNGIDPYQHFSQVFMLKKHPKVTKALISGAIDGGATWDSHLATMREQHGDIFTVLAQTVPIPFDAVVTSEQLSRTRTQQIKHLLLQAPREPLISLLNQAGVSLYGWQKTADSNYDPVRRLLKSQTSNKPYKALVLAIPPTQSIALAHKMWAPLIQYLSDETGRMVTLQTTDGYQELISSMKNGQFDIGVFPPFSYVKAKTHMPRLQYAATTLRAYADGRISDHYNGVLIALKKSNLTTLADLQSKRFAFTSKSSASGYLYPSAFLKRHQIIPQDYFAQTFMLKHHSKVIKALLSKAIDAGATTDDELYLAQRRYGDVFAKIGQTADIPFDAIAIAPHVNPLLQATLKAKILSLNQHPDAVEALRNSQWKYSGFIDKGDGFYDSVRAVQQTLKPTSSTP